MSMCVCLREHRLCALSRPLVLEVWSLCPGPATCRTLEQGGLGRGEARAPMCEHMLLPGCSVTQVGVCGRLRGEVTNQVDVQG